jgi:hypothetical protein
MGLIRMSERPTVEQGEQGVQGERGPRGEPGTMTPADRLQVRKTDRRLLILYLVGIALLVWVSINQVHSDIDRKIFQKAVIENCQANQANTRNFNKFIDQLIVTYNSSRVLTQAEKQEREVFFQAAKGNVPSCPPL